MGDVAVIAEGIGKRFKLGRHNDWHPTLQDAISSSMRSCIRLLRRETRHHPDKGEFWALRDVSFEIRHGESVAIIGNNGAGKTTLLKILSRITRPTTGEGLLRGRVASLLEVGTGFHPELTGAENVYLNGAILGMTRDEIKARFEEIVEFAEVSQFIHTPVKRYSSGMYLRLAFAVAAHLNPEILIVDEVLAVGDAAFQKKCLGKMTDITRQGRTILFVSHNLGAVQSLCRRAILLHRGSVLADTSASAAIATYLGSLESRADAAVGARSDRGGCGPSRISEVHIEVPGGQRAQEPATGWPVRFCIRVQAPAAGLTCSFTIYDQFGQPVTFFDSAVAAADDDVHSATPGRFVCDIEELPLMPGRYRVNVALYSGAELMDHVEAAVMFTVHEGQLGGRPVLATAGYGSIAIRHRWSAQEDSE